MKFCCKNFVSKKRRRNIEFFNDKENNPIITYDYAWREYIIFYGQFGNDINFCPWCGKKLPDALADMWYKILKEDYELEDPLFEDRKQVPAEFWTDEWWKKRGL